MMLSYWSNGNK